MARNRFGGNTVSVNLVAAADVVFQLLLFLMLTTDLSQRSIEQMRLPEVRGYTEEVKSAQLYSTYKINIVHVNPDCDKLKEPEKVCTDPFYKGGVCEDTTHWRKKYNGKEIKTSDELKRVLKDFARLGGALVSDRSENTVIIVADRRTPYAIIADMLIYLAQARIYKVKAFVEKKG
jgi:biopolymer transport protein ExbD